MRVLMGVRIFVFLIVFVGASSKKYQSSSRFGGRGLQIVGGAVKKKRWDPVEAAERINPSRAESLKSPVTSLTTERRACGIYLWNVLSAAKFHLCRSLLRDRVYEGRGGRRFVRIEPGSLLQLLYPLSQHSPDRCMHCGGSFRDHLALWWSKHLYTPYDLILDRVHEQGLAPEKRPKRTSGREKTKPYADSTARGGVDVASPSTLAYHRRYVFDMDILKQLGIGERDQTRLLKLAFPHLKWVGSDTFELRALTDLETSYMVPAIRRSRGANVGSTLLKFARAVVLGEIDSLIKTQAAENVLRKKSPIF